MTKTLTEQWREGTLPEGYYYVNNRNRINYYSEDDGYFDDGGIEEVNAPVPTYDEYQDILQQNVNQESAIETYIEEIKRLQEQLKEAQHTIYCIANTDGSDCKTILETIIRDANDYLEKWGVK